MFDTSNVTNMYAMFQNCQNLQILRIDNFTFNDNVFADSLFSSAYTQNIKIYVKSQTEKDYLLNKFGLGDENRIALS